MAAPPLRTALSDTYPNPSNAVMRTGMGAFWDYVTTLLGADGSAGAARTALGALAKAGDTLTGALNFNTAASIASATTTDIGAAASNMVTITGTATITGFGTIASGALRTVTFSGALTLTHNATTLILPGGANITTAAGDSGIFVSLGSGNWRCLSYQKASGAAVVGSGVTSVNGQTGAVVYTTLYAIGSFVIGRPASAIAYAVDSTIAGSSLYATSADATHSAGAFSASAGQTLINTGSWRCVSPAAADAGPGVGYAGLWVRYA